MLYLLAASTTSLLQPVHFQGHAGEHLLHVIDSSILPADFLLPRD